MRLRGLSGARRGKKVRTTVPDVEAACPLEIKRLVAAALAQKNTAHWLACLQPADVWCAEVLDWPRLLESKAFNRLDMLQTVRRGDGTPVHTTRGPLRIDGQRPQRARRAAGG